VYVTFLNMLHWAKFRFRVEESSVHVCEPAGRGATSAAGAACAIPRVTNPSVRIPQLHTQDPASITVVCIPSRLTLWRSLLWS
jgi:hypothetical protein